MTFLPFLLICEYNWAFPEKFRTTHVKDINLLRIYPPRISSTSLWDIEAILLLKPLGICSFFYIFTFLLWKSSFGNYFLFPKITFYSSLLNFYSKYLLLSFQELFYEGFYQTFVDKKSKEKTKLWKITSGKDFASESP